MSAQSSHDPKSTARSSSDDAALWARFRGALGEPVKPAGKSWLKLVPSTPPHFNWAAFRALPGEDRGDAAAILQRTWQIGLERHPLGQGVLPWAIDGGSHHFLDRVHRFDWLDGLMASGDTGAREGVDLVDAWIASHGKFDGFSWRAGPCADRVWNWMRCGEALFVGADGAPRHDRQDCLLRQVDHLEGLYETPIEPLTRFRIACVLVIIAALQGDDKAVGAAIPRLEAECSRQILPDGGHASRAPGQLLAAACDLLAVRDTLAATGQDAPAFLGKWLSRMGAMLVFFRADDGALYPFNGAGETDRGRVEGAVAAIDPAIRKFSFTPKSGYQKLDRGGLRLVLDVGAAAEGAFATAAHAGALGFELSRGGDRIVTSCGFCRAANLDWQAAVRRTGAHSTLILGGRDSARFEKNETNGLLDAIGPDGVSAKRLEEADEIWLDAQHSGYKARFGLLHRRRLFMAGDGNRLTGEDSLARPVSQPDTDDTHPIQFDVRFHLHPSVFVTPEDESIRIETESGDLWRFKTSHPGAAVEPSIYLGRGTVERTQQIVLSGRADPNGDGTLPTNCVRWAFVRDSGV